MKRSIFILFILFLAVGLFAEGKWRIAFSNDYAANSWRQQMLRDWQFVVDKAKGEGLIADAQAFTTNESSAAEQAAQIQNLILEGYNAIVLDASSPTALNGAVEQAAAAGIPVISFDNVVTSPKAYNLVIDFEWYGRNEVEYIAKNLTKTGNILEIRGLPGTFVNDAIHKGIAEGLKNYPGLKVVGEVYGNWDEATAQKAVAGILPSLPKIDAVVDQGGDGYGAVQAFQAAGRPVPMVMMGNRYDELAIWKQLKDSQGFHSWSACSQPASVQMAFWVALEVLNGKKVPHEMKVNPLVIPESKLDWFLAHTEKGGVASLFYPQDWVQTLIKNETSGMPAPSDPIGS
ncbi:MAG: ABC transporter substrate-binding protein [Spirochaetia bacterium]|jgi:ribose transport system substrate-binding protein